MEVLLREEGQDSEAKLKPPKEIKMYAVNDMRIANEKGAKRKHIH